MMYPDPGPASEQQLNPIQLLAIVFAQYSLTFTSICRIFSSSSIQDCDLTAVQRSGVIYVQTQTQIQTMEIFGNNSPLIYGPWFRDAYTQLLGERGTGGLFLRR